jgi:peptidoglycan/LPS O-acetylase OafA/YrhL
MRVPGFDALRAAAALAVVLFHYRGVRTPGDPAVEALSRWPGLDTIVAHGWLGVDVFFFLSGFLLILPWARAQAPGAALPGLREFYVRRIRRLVPGYYAHLVFLFAFCLPAFMGIAYVGANAGLVTYNVAMHALFLQFTTPLSAGSFGLNGALWTLTLEAEFYLLLPWIAPHVVRAPWRALAVAAVIGAAWQWLATNDLDAIVAWQLSLGWRWGTSEAAVRDLLDKQLPGFAPHFALGMALGTAWVRRSPRATRLPIIDGAGFAWGARVSYAAYLYHLPLLLIWNRLRILDGSPVSLPAFLFVLAVVSTLSWRLVERPFLREASSPRRL